MDFELRTFRRDPGQFGAASFNQDFCRSRPHNYRFFRDRIYSKRHQLGDIENLRRIGRASDALRGKDHAVVRTATASLMGVGVGGDIGMLLAPASGQKKLADISEKVKDVREKVRDRSSRKPRGASGTYGQAEADY
jgi:hypothetical protein